MRSADKVFQLSFKSILFSSCYLGHSLFEHLSLANAETPAATEIEGFLSSVWIPQPFKA